VRLAERERTIRRVRSRVAADADPILRHDVPHIVLAHRVVNDVDRPVVLDEGIAGPFERIAAGFVGELLHALPGPLGIEACSRDHDAIEGAPRLDLLFSTVPARVVGEDVLARLPKSALVVDLAAPPGGVDFDAAKRLGLNAIWGRGLGSRAPVTVGGSQWGGIRERIEKIVQEDP